MRDEIDIQSCAALVIVGGDGTIHEVVNGMMARKDKAKAPIGLVPNGSGNDTCRGIDIFDSKTALDTVLKGQTIKVDLVKVLLDFESEEELEKAIETSSESQQDGTDTRINRLNHLRYSLINSSYCLLANISRNCQWLKRGIGKNAYVVQTLIELARKRKETMDIELDEGALTLRDVTT